jgi:hypothetical protein
VSRGRALALAAAAAALAAGPGCAALRGWLVYEVEALRLEAPAAWHASGGARHLKLESPDALARVEISTPDAPLADLQACLADAERAMDRAGALERVRRHPTTFAGARGIAVEGDTGGWHVWAWAACDGGRPYHVFFTARTPASPAVLEVQRAVSTGARIGGES